MTQDQENLREQICSLILCHDYTAKELAVMLRLSMAEVLTALGQLQKEGVIKKQDGVWKRAI